MQTLLQKITVISKDRLSKITEESNKEPEPDVDLVTEEESQLVAKAPQKQSVITKPETQSDQNNPAQTTRNRKVPPFQVTDQNSWSQLRELIETHKIKLNQCIDQTGGNQGHVAGPDDFRRLTKIFEDVNYQFYTHKLSDENLHRFVIRGIPEVIPRKKNRSWNGSP